MSYEFEPDVGGNALPRVPAFFGAVGRIAHLLPNDPVFVGYQSVIQDPESQDIGIDAHDFVPNQAQLDHVKMLPIGVLRVCHIEPAIEGYIVDLRYSRHLIKRVLGFSGGEVPDEIAEQNKALETVPVLGAIFSGLGTGLLHFPCQEGKETILQPHAAVLAEWVDSEREKHGIPTLSGELEETPNERLAKEYLREA